MSKNENPRLAPLQNHADVIRVARVALGKDFPHWKIHVLRLLDLEDELLPCLQKDLLSFCVQRSRPYELDLFDITEICVMMTAKTPRKANEWLHFFVLAGLRQADEKENAPNRHFHLGLALGIFQAGLWLDQNWRDASLQFHKILPGLVVELIRHSCPAVELPELQLGEKELFGSTQKEAESISRFEAKLSQAIKAYFRPEPDHLGCKGDRLAHVINIQQSLVDYYEAGKKLSPLGEMILRQINFAMAGPMSPLGHAAALAQFWNRFLLSEPKKEILNQAEELLAQAPADKLNEVLAALKKLTAKYKKTPSEAGNKKVTDMEKRPPDHPSFDLYGNVEPGTT